MMFRFTAVVICRGAGSGARTEPLAGMTIDKMTIFIDWVTKYSGLAPLKLPSPENKKAKNIQLHTNVTIYSNSAHDVRLPVYITTKTTKAKDSQQDTW